MRIKNLFGVFVVFAFGLLLYSCNDKDGDWDSMEWRVENFSPQNITYNKKTHEIKVNPKGGSINIVCINYSHFWFDMPALWFDMPSASSVPSFEDCKGEWYDLSIKGNVMRCAFKGVDSEVSNDTLYVAVTAGDIFSRFKIIRTSR